QHSPMWLFTYPGAVLLAAGMVGAAVLSQGPVAVTPAIELDVHTLVAACFAMLIGVQMIMFGALARRYSIIEGFLPRPRRGERFLLGFGLETVLQGALGLFVLGLIGAVWAVGLWAQTHFGPLNYPGVMRLLVLSLTAVAASVQIAAAGFLASVLSIRK
ncbi:MAG: hypothetical protein ACXWVJ_09580, partial [Caulobacteraceae bacterium]